MKVLILGDQRSKMRFEGPAWEGQNIEFSDNPDPSNGPYDYIILDHIIQQFKRNQVLQVINAYVGALVEGGQLALIVPSLEWACREIAMNDEPNPMAYLSIYGDDAEPNQCGMTLLWMRLIIEQAGLLTIQANSELLSASIMGQPFKAEQNIVIGMLVKDRNPAEAFRFSEMKAPEFIQ